MLPNYVLGAADRELGVVTRRNAMKTGAAIAGGLGLGGASGVAAGEGSVRQQDERRSNATLFLEEIKGELPEPEGSMEVLAWEWGGSTPVTIGSGRGAGTGKTTFDGLTVTKLIDRATPALWEHLTTGSVIETGRLRVDTLTIELERVLISDISTNGPVEEQSGMENVTLRFGQFTIVVDDATFGFDITQHSPV